jgi:hypothetical protein
MITKIEAVRSLFGQDSYDVCRADGYVKWKDGHTTTAKETTQIDAEVIKLQAEYDAKAYSRKRAAEYPSIADQLDDIYHNGIDAWKTTIKKTKDKYPKP